MRAVAALALLGLAACATADAPIASAPHLRWPVPAEAAPPDSPTLGVGELRDARPEALREGEWPPLELRFLALVREGTVRSGDESFDRPLAEAARADVEATLARSGSFASVVPVEFDPREAAAWPASGAPDAVLVGELEELWGAQHRSFVVTPFRIGFVRDRWGDPEGRFAATFELWTRTGRAWGGRVRARVDGGDGGPAATALDALAEGSESLAGRLAAALRPASRGARDVPLLVLDGCGLGAFAAERPVEDASAIFLREADVRFEPSSEAWYVPADAHTLDELLRAARAVKPPSGGVVLALAPAERVRERELGYQRTGLAEPLGAHAVALCSADGAPSALTTAHELAHLFGALHVHERASIMSPTADFDASFFDPLNRRILHELRLRKFGQPLSASESARLRAIYRVAETAPDAVDAADLGAALRALAADEP